MAHGLGGRKMRTGNILANSLHLISKRECIKKSIIVSCDWRESESHTSMSVLEPTVHFEAPFRL